MRYAFLLIGILYVDRAPAQNIQHGLRVPVGFEVSEFADSTLANDIYTMTLDPKGRVVVASRGYIRLLIDADGDGKADRSVEVADAPKDGAMGLFWEGDTLYFTGDGGLQRFHIKDDRAAGPPELLCKLRTGGEHSAHAIRRGPDGWLYVLCGNNTDVDKYVTPTSSSPIKNPIAGVVLRFSPDFKKTEIVAHGFRNPYDMDFNADGELFTYDSDNERCVSLPWYEPTRFYHVRDGQHHGWLNPHQASFWRLPPYYFDVNAPLCTLGRGSPTGCVCYRHGQFPEKYRGSFFLCDWTFGVIHHVSLKRTKSSYDASSEVFLRATGENGFAPTAAVVHPETGDLYVSIGGRGTRGGVYRIRYPQGMKEAKAEAARWRIEPRTLNSTYRGDGLEPYTAPKKYDLKLADAYLETTEQEMKNVGEFKSMIGVRRLQLLAGHTIPLSERGGVWEGYARELVSNEWPHLKAIRSGLPRLFPTGKREVDREISRLLAILEVNDRVVFDKVLDQLTAQSDPMDDIHYLIVLSRLKTARTKDSTSKIAEALLALDAKITAAKLHRDSNWPLRIKELYRELARKDSKLNDSMLSHKEFGRPDHVLWTQYSGFNRRQAAALFLDRAAKDKDFAWNAGLVQLLSEISDTQSLPVLRKLWDNAGLNEAILPILARRPAVEDRERFLQGLASPSLTTVRRSLDALARLSLEKDEATLLALVQAMRLLPDGKEEERVRSDIGKLLRKVTGQDLKEGDRQAWIDWLSKAHPTTAAKLGGEDGVDMSAWSKRLAAIDWNGGDGERGRIVFTKASCLSCHSGSQALGPDLQGVAGRFSRDDLLTAILRPSKDVSARYRTTVLTTSDDKSYQGVIIYEAVDSVMLLTGQGTTVRLTNKQIAEKKVSPISLMPTGLLDRLSNAEIADLYAYMRSLKPR